MMASDFVRRRADSAPGNTATEMAFRVFYCTQTVDDESPPVEIAFFAKSRFFARYHCFRLKET